MAGTAPSSSTFDGNAALGLTAPYRPGVDDANGAALKNKPVNPPNPGTQPTAELLNWLSLQSISAGRSIACAGVAVNASASPSVAFWWTAANNIQANPFTLTRVAAGHYQIFAAAGTLPAPNDWPKVSLNGVLGAHNYAASAVPYASGGNVGVEVYTVIDAVLADVNFSVRFH